jgi:glyoxylase-like metal-dependent hydrolase (beta-lactamase superfamily II)
MVPLCVSVGLQDSGMDVIRVGDLVVQPILDGVAILEPRMFTIGDEPSDWTEHEHLLGADGNLTLPVGAFVVRTGKEIVLMDAGVGVTDDAMFEGAALIENLAAVGLRPSDISIVTVSHLHSDHCGWLEADGKSVFSNARIRIGAADWEHFVLGAGGGRKRAARLRVVEEQVDLIDTDGVTVAPGITSRHTPGHTPGHTSFVISSGTERLIVLGDAMHCPAQLTETEWEFLYDTDRELAKRTREALVREAEEPGTALLPMHFPGMTSARLLPGQGKRQWLVGAGGS